MIDGIHHDFSCLIDEFQQPVHDQIDPVQIPVNLTSLLCVSAWRDFDFKFRPILGLFKTFSCKLLTQGNTCKISACRKKLGFSKILQDSRFLGVLHRNATYPSMFIDCHVRVRIPGRTKPESIQEHMSIYLPFSKTLSFFLIISVIPSFIHSTLYIDLPPSTIRPLPSVSCRSSLIYPSYHCTSYKCFYTSSNESATHRPIENSDVWPSESRESTVKIGQMRREKGFQLLWHALVQLVVFIQKTL